MLLSGADITLGQHERCYLLAVPPTKHPGQAGPTRWRAFRRRREPTSEATIDYPQQVPQESPKSDNPGSYPPRLFVFAHASKTHCQVINHHQAIYAAVIPQCNKKAKVSSSLFNKRRQEARAKGAIKGSYQYMPMSHPFVERLIGSVRPELLDQTLFWTATDLENKLRAYQDYYNEHRCHAGRDGATPIERDSKEIVDINNYRWERHCRGLFQLPVAA